MMERSLYNLLSSSVGGSACRAFQGFYPSFFVACFSPLLAVSQGIQQTSYGAADAVRSWPSVIPDLTPSNPLGLPGSSLVGPRGSENISLSSSMFRVSCRKYPIFNLDTIIPLGRSYGQAQLPLTICFLSSLELTPQYMGKLMESYKVSRLPRPDPQTTVWIYVLEVDIGGCSAIIPWSGYIPFSTRRDCPEFGIHLEA